jgi:hypothetical protein
MLIEFLLSLLKVVVVLLLLAMLSLQLGLDLIKLAI